MKNKSKKIQQLVEENFFHKEEPSDEEFEEDNLVKRTVDDILGENIEEFPNSDAITSFGAFKRTTFPADDIQSSKTCSGKRISRKSFEEESENESDGSESDLSEAPEIYNVSKKPKTVTFADHLKTKKVTFADPLRTKKVTFADPLRTKKVTFADPLRTKKVTFADPLRTKKVTFADQSSESDEPEYSSENDDEDIELEKENEAEEIDEEESEDDETDDDEEDESAGNESGIEDDLSEDEMLDPTFMYSSAVRDEDGDRAKGEAIRAQLNLCELLLESRITLQKALFAANQFPRPQNYEKIWADSSEEEKNSVIQCRESIWDLLEKLLSLQSKFRKQCPEFLATLDESARTEYDESEPTIKRRKLTEYPAVLEKLHDEYIPYRNTVLQKWHDRTRIASGRLAKTDFSAFDVPITKQLEEALVDKRRLIERTHVKRTDYKLIGDEEPNEVNQDNEENSESKPDEYRDDEIFDDDDFYHKLLRDYIERKTAEVSDPTQLGRKWIKLQSLRSKMKRKIDTRRTKGRKIKFDVHPRLVNFMAPVTVNSWTDTAVNELFSSVFGTNLINS